MYTILRKGEQGMLIKRVSEIPSSEVTPKWLYLNRRKFLASAMGVTAGVLVGEGLKQLAWPSQKVLAGSKLNVAAKSPFSTTEQVTPFNDVTHYNNFYEFGVDKGDPAKNAGGLPTRPWTVKVEGKVAKPHLRHRRPPQAPPA